MIRHLLVISILAIRKYEFYTLGNITSETQVSYILGLKGCCGNEEVVKSIAPVK